MFVFLQGIFSTLHGIIALLVASHVYASAYKKNNVVLTHFGYAAFIFGLDRVLEGGTLIFLSENSTVVRYVLLVIGPILILTGHSFRHLYYLDHYIA